MKLFLALLLALPLAASTACQATPAAAQAAGDSNAEEYAIYKLVIEDVCQPVESMPVLNTTVPNHLNDLESDEPYKFVRDNLRDLRSETLDDWWDKNRERTPLAYKLDLAHGNVLVSDADKARVPAYPGYAEVSRVGFDSARAQAFVYCGHHWKLSGFQGRGYYVALGKRDGRWQITNKLAALMK
jgi:hypothetical protein